MRKFFFVLALAGLGMVAMTAPSAANAQAASDFFVASRTLPMAQSARPNRILVVFDAKVAETKVEADAIVKEYGDAIELGRTTYAIELVEASNYKRRAADASMLYFTKNLSVPFETIAQDTANSGLITASANLECVRAGVCVLGVASRPRVLVLISPEAASNVAIEFGQQFMLLAKTA